MEPGIPKSKAVINMLDFVSYLLGKANRDAPYQPVFSGLEFETGEWTPVEDTAQGNIEFSNVHSTPPDFAFVILDDQTYDDTLKNCFLFAYLNFEKTVQYLAVDSTGGKAYAVAYATSRSTNAEQLANNTKLLLYSIEDTAEELTPDYPSYYVSNTALKPYNNYADRTWKSTKSYKWYAVWL